MTSASVLIVLLVGVAVGALVGLLLDGTMENWYIALLAGFLASTIGVVIRNMLLARGAGLGPDDSKTPMLVLIYAAISSLGAGSLALELARRSGLEADGPVWIGTLAGLFASILLVMLMVTYHTHPGKAPTLVSKHHR